MLFVPPALAAQGELPADRTVGAHQLRPDLLGEDAGEQQEMPVHCLLQIIELLGQGGETGEEAASSANE